MSKINLVRNAGETIAHCMFGNGKTIVDPKKAGMLVAGAVAVATAKIVLETSDRKATMTVNQDGKEQIAEFEYDADNKLISADSKYYDSKKEEHYNLQGEKTFSEVVYHTRPLSDDVRKNIDMVNSKMAETRGYKSTNTEFSSGDYSQIGAQTAKKKLPAILDMILSMFPSSDAVKLNIKEKCREKGDGASILGFETLDKNVRGLISSVGDSLTYHIDTPDMTVVGEQTNCSQSYTTYVKEKVSEAQIDSSEQIKAIEKQDEQLVTTKEPIATTKGKAYSRPIDQLTDGDTQKLLEICDYYNTGIAEADLQTEMAEVLNNYGARHLADLYEEDDAVEDIFCKLNDLSAHEIDDVGDVMTDIRVLINDLSSTHTSTNRRETLLQQMQSIPDQEAEKEDLNITTEAEEEKLPMQVTQENQPLRVRRKRRQIQRSSEVMDLRAKYKEAIKENPEDIAKIQREYYSQINKREIKDFNDVKYILGVTSHKELERIQQEIYQIEALRRQQEAKEKLEAKRNTTPVHTIEQYGEKVVDIILNYGKTKNTTEQYQKILAQAYLDGYNKDDLVAILGYVANYLKIENPNLKFSQNAIAEHCQKAIEIASREGMTAPARVQSERQTRVKIAQLREAVQEDVIYQNLVSLYETLDQEAENDIIAAQKKELLEILQMYMAQSFNRDKTIDLLGQISTTDREILKIACDCVMEEINHKTANEYKKNIETLLTKIPDSSYKEKEAFKAQLYSNLNLMELKQLEDEVKSFLYSEKTLDVDENSSETQMAYKTFSELNNGSKKLIKELLMSEKKANSLNISYDEALHLLLDIGFVQKDAKFTLTGAHFATKHTKDTNHIMIQKEGNQLDTGAKSDIQNICRQFYGKDVENIK